MSFVVILLITVGVTVYALVDCWQSTDDEVRGLPRPAWILLIVLGLPPVGGGAYLVLGRPSPTALRQGRVIAPDDDPEFLRKLDLDRRRAAAEQRRREQRERREREKQERQERQRRDQPASDAGAAGPEPADGDGH